MDTAPLNEVLFITPKKMYFQGSYFQKVCKVQYSPVFHRSLEFGWVGAIRLIITKYHFY